MDEKYIGRVCPHCKTPIGESDEIVVCPRCGTAMHLACRNETGRCVAVGCGEPEEVEPTDSVPADKTDEAQDNTSADGASDIENTQELPSFRADIYSNPSFCPACGKPIEYRTPQCPYCGLTFGDRDTFVPPAPVKPKKHRGIWIALVALVLCAGIAAASFFGLRAVRRERMQELQEELCDNVWQCQQIADDLFADSLFTVNYSITFSANTMDISLNMLFFGSSNRTSTPYEVLSPREIRLGSGTEAVVYRVKCFDTAAGDSMQWTAPDGSVLDFIELND